jgi:ribonuclease P protein component
MLPRSALLRSPEVERLLKEGKSASLGALRAKYLPRPKGGARFAFIVGKKVAGDAVTRNRLRRWASALARTGAYSSPVDIAVMIGKRYESASALAPDLEALIGKIVQTAPRA